jgi:rhomboid family GlyGly-CTERM serine protease
MRAINAGDRSAARIAGDVFRQATGGLTAWRLELGTLAVVIALLNLPMLAGVSPSLFAYFPGAVQQGEWWRVLTHPFVHVSWYHLLLCVAAFFMAYVELRHRRWLERLLFLVGSGAVGLLVALWTAPQIDGTGLCGLSGIAHGLTVVIALDMLEDRQTRATRWMGLACLAGVVVKCVFEAVSGHILLESWHFGMLGAPIAVCHAGGVLGSLLVWVLLRARNQAGEVMSRAAGEDSVTKRTASSRLSPDRCV